jgi:hypothetical protein
MTAPLLGARRRLPLALDYTPVLGGGQATNLTFLYKAALGYQGASNICHIAWCRLPD